MSLLFWICWTIDVLLCAIAIIGKGFANSFHKSSAVPWLAILLLGFTIAGFCLQVFIKKPVWAVSAAAFPIVFMLGLYFFEKMTE